jgi:predicted hotdog family 3-hydroxylacyl-ACP dehydratase
LINHSKITDYIPQREPFVMVSEICSANEKMAITKFSFTDDNIFCADGNLQESGIIENIAQTAAAMAGYNAISKNEKIKNGFIGGISNLKIYNLPKSNSEIETEVSIENQVMNVNFINGFVWQNKNIIAECQMKIFLED